ncbi:hypothetical protein Ahia01_000914100 [Argonauta hians]
MPVITPMSLLFLLSAALFLIQGVDSSRRHRIVSGQSVTKCGLPYVVSVSVTKKDGTIEQCAGAIVGPTQVITAAHCVSDNVKEISVKVRPSDQQPTPAPVAVVHHTIHRDYTTTADNIDSDVAMITVATAFTFSQCVKSVEIAGATDEFVEDCTISGWGKTSMFTNGMSKTLQQAQVPLMQPGECARYVAAKANQLCVGTGKFEGAAICQGDSGGPLVCKRKSDGKNVLAGVASFGWSCTEGVSVFARVSYFKKWIDNQLNNRC